MNMFKTVKATSLDEYIAALPEAKRETFLFFHTLILQTVPSLKPNFLYNMPGYGSFPYKNAKKEIIEWPVISLASQKNYFSIYVCAMAHNEYLAEKWKDKLGKVDVGKSCIRIKKIEDVNLDTLKNLLVTAEKSPGFGQR